MQTNLSAQEFAGKLLGIYTGGVLTKLIDIGCQTGLFEASVEGAATSDELAARAGLDERYVREWLGAMATSGIFLYDPASGRYRLPQEHAVSLTGAAARNVSPMSGIIDHFGKHLPKLVKCFREGGGIPYSEYRPEFTCHMDATWRSRSSRPAMAQVRSRDGANCPSPYRRVARSFPTRSYAGRS